MDGALQGERMIGRVSMLCRALPALAFALLMQTVQAAEDQPIPEVVVEGQHEGPRMWRVSKADHTLWILGTISPLPRKMTWQSDSVEAVLKETQEVVPAWPSVSVGYNPFTAIRLYFVWRKIQKSPDHAKLQEQIPPALYARFSALKAR